MENKYFSNTIARAFKIMEMLAKHKSAGLKEIADYLNAPRSSIFNVLYTLEKIGYVNKNSQNFYELNSKVMFLANSFLSQNDLRLIVKPFMKEIVLTTRETCHLAVLLKSSYEIVYIDQVQSPQTVSLKGYIGAVFPAYATSLGKVLLANLEDSEFEKFLNQVDLQPLTEHTITSKAELKKEISKAKAQGYAVDNMEIDLGIRCIAIPVKRINGEVVAAISISAPKERMDDVTINNYSRLLLEYGEKISKELSNVI